jgi:Cft2 family RNA processing exonuclease
MDSISMSMHDRSVNERESRGARARFLGGASGVGASSVLVQLGPCAALIDAGVRMDAGDRLPDLAMLEQVKPACVFVTHAHADHIGALPLVHESFPDIPIYTTMATSRLMAVMLADATRVMARRAHDEMELPLYDEGLVARTLQRLRPVPASGSFTVPELPEVIVHTAPAGHIAGAVSVGLESAHGRVLVSGDLSLARQRTIGGAVTPSLRRPDLLVLESTYGARLHPNRAAEELRLARAVAEAVERGRCLIPAFALGRAQEICLILRTAQRDRVIPEFPIYLDGLVRTVCAAYATIPEALAPPLARQVRRGQPVFLGGSVREVASPAERQQVIGQDHLCVIASSGMLTGGPSAFYAAQIAGDARATIMITGYQDEESPGRRLLDLADQGEGELELEGRTVTTHCRVERYSLSAHADAAELARFARALRPRQVALVHGDPEARAALGVRLREFTIVRFPEDGEDVELTDAPPRRTRRPDAGGVGRGQPFQAQAAWERLGDGSGVQVMTLPELADAWFGRGGGEGEQAIIRAALAGDRHWFQPVPELEGSFRLVAARELRPAGRERRREAAPPDAEEERKGIDQQAILAVVERHLGGTAELYRRGIDPDSGRVTLYFHFPDRARELHAEAIAAVRKEAGVEVALNPYPHPGELERLARELTPAGLIVLSDASFLPELRAVRVRVAGEVASGIVEASQAEFRERTGWELLVEQRDESRTAPMPPPVPPAAGDVLDQLRALQVARELLTGRGLYRVGANSGAQHLQLRFRFPAVAIAQAAQEIREVERRTGWKAVVDPHPHQQALELLAVQCLPPGTRKIGSPSLRPAQREMVLRVAGLEGQADTERFERESGWRLVLEIPSPGGQYR